MTYCVAIGVDRGLVFASDSRTHAGADNVSHYAKMHTYGRDGERQMVLLSAGNLATTQAVRARIGRAIRQQAELNLLSVDDVEQAAEYVGELLREQVRKHASEEGQSGFNAEASFILGGQIAEQDPALFLIYPQGNYITTSEQTPYLQLGESKYGRPILGRILRPDTPLDDAALCALVSMDSTLRSNVTVGPPIELLVYERDSLALERYLRLEGHDPYLVELRQAWGEKLAKAFTELPPVRFKAPPSKPRFG